MNIDLEASVTTIMSTTLRTASPDDPVIVLDELFKKNRIHHVPITEEGHVVGIISKSDFLFLLRGFTENQVDSFREKAKLRAFKVEEIMEKEVVTIGDHETIRAAVEILAENRFRSLPVVDESKTLVGIVTTHDIIDMVLGRK